MNFAPERIVAKKPHGSKRVREIHSDDEEDGTFELSPMKLDTEGGEGGDDEDAETGRGVRRPLFGPLPSSATSGGKIEYRKIRCPPNRLTPLRNQWEQIMTPIVQHLKLQIRFNPKSRSVELKTAPDTEDFGVIQKAQDFLEAYMMGFEIQDAVALLRLEDLYVESFLVSDVRILQGDHMSRAIGRIVGQEGKTRFAIENATRTRIVIADQKIHILGTFANIALARDAICNLIIGAPPGKVYNQMRNVAKRMNERF